MPTVDQLPLPGEVFEIDGCSAFLIMPTANSAAIRASGAPIEWVWYAPTLGHHPADTEKWMFERFAAHGLAIAGVDVGESYGSPSGRAVYSSLHSTLVARGLSQRARLLARSRGGLMLYNWAAEHPDCVVCIAGIYPVCDLRSYPGLAKACGAYEMSVEALENALAEHNPIARLAPLAHAGVPIYHIHGDNDAVVPLADNSAALKNTYQALGGEMKLNIVKDGGHDLSPIWFECAELVSFIIEHE